MKAVGANIPRYDGVAHVTAASRFIDDVKLPGMLWAKALRSPLPSARILRLDTAAAEKMPGVHAVITHSDVPKNVVGHQEVWGIAADEPLLAEHEVRYVGQLIAVVAAESEAQALAAVQVIEVAFEERPAFLDVRQAWDPGQAQVAPDGNVYFYYPDQPQRQVRKGDVAGAFARADVIVEGTYRPGAIEQAPAEPASAISVVEPTGRVTIYSTSQALYYSMEITGRHLCLPTGQLKFVGGTVGGGFGGKLDTLTEPVTAVLAMKARRPVKWRWTREEEMLCSSTRASWHIEIADALTRDGWILGRRTLTLHDAGAYMRTSAYACSKHTFHLAGAYSVPACAFNTFVVMTNHVPTAAMRGFGVTSASFAVETHMNRVAEVLGMSPWELRLRNANRVADTSPSRVAYANPSTVSTLLAAAQATGEELPAELAAMTNAKREGDLLPAHLVEQQREPGTHLLAWRDGRPALEGGN
ncbi:MAG: molybdopterin cofactor-binding domain-containing protein [Acidimicrobiales bacterium]|jgi:CO/xanthine dehydrogenase Mo-binding subunit